MSGPVYYNEFDPYPAQWLCNLAEQGLIPGGLVDERDIREVQPGDLDGYDQCHFFAGIGGWPLALQLAGWGARPVWTASCPCQPFSAAGKRKGTEDERHLWPELLRLIAARRPPTIFGEQVASADGRKWLAGVRLGLETLGYRFGAADLCAAGVGAPHIRQRLFWVAESQGEQRDGAGLARTGGRTYKPLHGWRSPDANSRGGGYADPVKALKRQTSGHQINLEDQAILAGWASPRANKWGFPDSHGDNQIPLTAQTEKRGVLSPEHSRWLMGFPTAWASCAPTATRSSLKQPHNS